MVQIQYVEYKAISSGCASGTMWMQAAESLRRSMCSLYSNKPKVLFQQFFWYQGHLLLHHPKEDGGDHVIQLHNPIFEGSNGFKLKKGTWRAFVEGRVRSNKL
jgi:hypothetical protein